ncbi:Uncharacterised protein [Sebaldella termitidis]|uniref:Uncharacterized protein n=1 Tax=Sebaldella termitidis (strain ATCC 33386 / NCTC 11300) TaxID=526218 RepID=D1AQY3_SEBTE|nr:hypothetical protein [Sebaldella termitidis]ACZ07671.1 hypothetical protein Sterm_0799 [Sebaldella termitidis ATCC 33386]SUI22967.1 Uncharacterised protein [Sebaldella termitidis]
MERLNLKNFDNNLHEYVLLDVLELKDGRKGIVTSFGSKDQYLVDVFYGKECRLAGADWVWKNEILAKSVSQREYIEIYLNELINFTSRHRARDYYDEDIEYIKKHLSKLENGGN